MSTSLPLLSNIEKYILNPIIVLFFGIALVVFAWGLIEFLWSGDASEKGRPKAIRNMIWGVFGMAIMVSVYGIMDIIVETMCQLVGKSC